MMPVGDIQETSQFEVGQPFFSRNVIERMGTEDEIALDLQFVDKIGVPMVSAWGMTCCSCVNGWVLGLDRRWCGRRPRRSAGEFPVAGAGIDEDLSRGQVVDHSLQQPLRAFRFWSVWSRKT